MQPLHIAGVSQILQADSTLVRLVHNFLASYLRFPWMKLGIVHAKLLHCKLLGCLDFALRPFQENRT